MTQKPFLRQNFTTGAPLPPARIPVVTPAVESIFKGLRFPGSHGTFSQKRLVRLSKLGARWITPKVFASALVFADQSSSAVGKVGLRAGYRSSQTLH